MTALAKAACVNRHVGIAVRLAREERRMSVQHLAATVGLSADGVRRIEAGVEEANAVDLHLIAEALGVDVSAFFCGLDQPKPPPRSTADPSEEIGFADLLNATIGVRLRRAREERCMTATELARRTGIRVVRLRRIERGDAEAAASELHALASRLGLSVSFFFDGSSETAEELFGFGGAYGLDGVLATV